jgi:hypothetical protein
MVVAASAAWSCHRVRCAEASEGYYMMRVLAPMFNKFFIDIPGVVKGIIPGCDFEEIVLYGNTTPALGVTAGSSPFEVLVL